MKKIKNIISACLIAAFLTACSTTLYDHYSFTQTLEAKAKAISLINVSDQPYSNHAIAVQELENHIKMMRDYEQAKSKNDITIQMWQYLNSEQSAISGFIKLWEEQQTLSTPFKEEFRPQIERVFDLMADYETRKSKQSENLLLDLITG